MKKVLVRRVRIRRQMTPAAKRAKTGAKLLDMEVLEKFNPSMLDMGDLSSPAREIEAVTAVFDLSGFTKFCNQADAYLAIPKFLNDFLGWFFNSIRMALTENNDRGLRSFWVDLPVMVKFLGDGVMLLWNARGMTEWQICRIVGALYDICHAYRREFYPKISTSVNKPPSVLRCGVARGKVFSIGNGNDYVGHCINSAARLTQLGMVSFCFPHRGFQIRDYMSDEYCRIFVPKYVSIRGVGDNELVWLVRDEYDRLPERNKGLFRNIEN